MQLKDLQDGWKVKTNDGEVLTIDGDKLFEEDGEFCRYLNDLHGCVRFGYNQNLTHAAFANLDIIEVIIPIERKHIVRFDDGKAIEISEESFNTLKEHLCK